MKTFPGWREAGRAMRWARQQNDVRSDVTTIGGVTDTRWRCGDSSLVVVQCFGGCYASTTINVTSARIAQHSTDVALVLRILAALDLIPAELAEATS